MKSFSSSILQSVVFTFLFDFSKILFFLGIFIVVLEFPDRKLSGSFPGRSLPDLRGGGSVDSGADEDSTDSLIDESEAYLRRSIDSIVGDGADEPVFVKRGRRPRSYSQPDHVFTNGE